MRTTLALTMILAACGDGGGSTDITPTLRFADLTDSDISRLVSAASGSEGFQAQATALSFDEPFEPDPCPAVAVDGTTVTLTGGCTMMDGTAIEGTAVIENAPWGDLDNDFRADTVYTFTQFALVQQGFRRAYDGVFRIGSGYGELDMDLTADTLGVAVRSDIYMDCGSSSCTVSGSGVELVGAGGAVVGGRISVGGGTSTGSFTLKGVDTVRVTVADNCVAWELEGTDRAFAPCAGR